MGTLFVPDLCWILCLFISDLANGWERQKTGNGKWGLWVPRRFSFVHRHPVVSSNLVKNCTFPSPFFTETSPGTRTRQPGNGLFARVHPNFSPRQPQRDEASWPLIPDSDRSCQCHKYGLRFFRSAPVVFRFWTDAHVSQEFLDSSSDSGVDFKSSLVGNHERIHTEKSERLDEDKCFWPRIPERKACKPAMHLARLFFSLKNLTMRLERNYLCR